jgi:hypothetical protein
VTKQFDEAEVSRHLDGKFGEKLGSQPEVSLAPTLTPTRQEALSKAADGEVTHMMSTRLGGKNIPAHYRIDHRKVPGAAYEWLRANGYIRHDSPSLRGTKVILTEAGEAAYSQS